MPPEVISGAGGGRRTLRPFPGALWGKAMTASIPRLMKTAIAAFVVLLGTMETGCVRHPTPITWEASGVRLTELDLPLTGDGVSFKVGEYLLEGQEGSGGSGRQFHDRHLLTADLRRSQGPVFGYVSRTYRNGGTRVLRLHGWAKRPAGDPEVIVVVARSYSVEYDGSTRAWASTDMLEFRLDPVIGHVSARGF